MSLDSNATLLPCPFCGAAGNAENGFAPLESVVYAYCSNSHCHLHDVDIGFSPREWNARHQQDSLPVWVAVEDALPKCSKKPNSMGVPVLVYPPYNEDGASQMTQAFYGCRQTDKPNFYIFGRVFYPTHWQYIPSPPEPLMPKEAK